MSGALWYPPATQMTLAKDGGSMVGGPSRGTLHTTETKGWAGTGNSYHMQVRYYGPGDVRFQQYIPFNRAARSLRNESGGVQTNRQGKYHPQLGIVWYAGDAANMPLLLLEQIRIFMQWCLDEFEIKRIAPPIHLQGGNWCYGVSSPCRLSFGEWNSYNAWAAHQNVPENTHWDCGLINWEYLTTGQGGSWDMPITPSSPKVEIESLQALLVMCGGFGETEVEEGYESSEVDGNWGPGTQTALDSLTASLGLLPGVTSVDLALAANIGRLAHRHTYQRQATIEDPLMRRTTETLMPWT